jgi:hypothetical protein
MPMATLLFCKILLWERKEKFDTFIFYMETHVTFKSVVESIVEVGISVPEIYEEDLDYQRELVGRLIEPFWPTIYRAFLQDDRENFYRVASLVSDSENFREIDGSLVRLIDIYNNRIVQMLFTSWRFREAIEFMGSLDSTPHEGVYEWARDEGYVRPGERGFNIDWLERTRGGVLNLD